MEIEIKGLSEFREAIARNPEAIRQAINRFLTRGIAVYNRLIIRSPWQVGMSGGGAPVRTGNLRDTHQRTISAFEARIKAVAPYAEFVHDGTSKMTGRPWLDYAQEEGQGEIENLSDEMVEEIVNNLAS